MQSKPPLIDGMLYPGTYIFAGAPKLGKSFFMAQLAYHISTGNHPVAHLKTTLFNEVEDENTFKIAFFKIMHLFKAKATLSDYLDLNRRYIKTTDTESAQENGFYRLKRLGISQYFKHIYTSESEYESNIPLDEKIITVKSKKPDKDVLINICNQENCSISDAAYIGDSLTKDVYMAKLANITSIWANYPKEKNNYYDLLVDITSWTEDDFIREKELKKQYISFGIKPDYTISKFSQLLPIILQEK